ncbi:ceramide kinase-like isoform X1 [Mytilus galloprovincialis]|uniref:ceramide kinase-like isoform X1 n=1 Tax=Mytilus galloprovincialis TaxID=29158 RepID=UPI003F7C255F
MLYLNDNRVNVSLEGGVMTVASEENNLLASIEIRYLLKSVLERTNLNVHYVIQKKNMNLKVKTLVLHGDEEDAQMLHSDIEHILKDRPRRLLVIINPNSGKRKGMKIYQKVAAPLFQLCGLKAHVIVTKKQKEPTDILKNYNLSNIDGIVTVGGDGLYCECMNGLIARVQRDNNVNVNCHNTDIVSASIPMGIIPAGSGNVIVQYLHGTKCARTAVLHILLGGNVESNVCSAHEGGKLLSYSALILGFGLFGDMMHDCEKFRWMGPLRYNVVPVASMFKRREIDVEIEYYSANKEKATKRIKGLGKQISLPNGFMIPSSKSKIQRTKSTPGVLDSSDVQECEKEEGRVYAVDTHAIMMKEKSGRMIPSFGQDSLMVYTTHKCTLSDHVSQLTKVKNEQPDCYDYKFVSKHKVSSYKVRLLNATVSENTKTLQKDFFLNCDGEVIRITEPEFDVKLHKKAVRIFGNASG